jgi:hypothetical protein
MSAEPAFEEKTPRDRVWAPSGMAGGIVGFDNNSDDVELNPEKDSVRRHGGLRISNAALPSVPRKSMPAGRIKRKAQFARETVLNPSPAPATDPCPRPRLLRSGTCPYSRYGRATFMVLPGPT